MKFSTKNGFHQAMLLLSVLIISIFLLFSSSIQKQLSGKLFLQKNILYILNGLAAWSLAPLSITKTPSIYTLPLVLVAGINPIHKNSPVSLHAAIAPSVIHKNSPITLGWILDTGSTAISSVANSTPGLSVLSPKWFHVDGLNGAISGSAEVSVIQNAHQHHRQVWAVVDNGFNGTLSHEILRYQDQQNMLIQHILSIAIQDHLNGINLDFEGLIPLDRWNFSRFVTVLANKLHKHHLLLSVDLPPDYVSGNNTGPYNHAVLAKAANYIVLMGYDEYWLGDPYAGPTASLPWVKSAVQDFLDTGVPAKKLILGIPFYTEDWTLNKKGNVISSIALSSRESNQLISQLRLHLIWNPKEGVYFSAYKSQGLWHEIWLENNRTLMLFTELARNKQLAGIAAWYLGLESKSMWLSVLHTLRSPVIRY